MKRDGSVRSLRPAGPGQCRLALQAARGRNAGFQENVGDLAQRVRSMHLLMKLILRLSLEALKQLDGYPRQALHFGELAATVLLQFDLYKPTVATIPLVSISLLLRDPLPRGNFIGVDPGGHCTALWMSEREAGPSQHWPRRRRIRKPLLPARLAGAYRGQNVERTAVGTLSGLFVPIGRDSSRMVPICSSAPETGVG